MKYKGRELASVYTILRRLISYPVVQIGRLILCIGLFIGFSKDEAIQTFKDTK